MATLSFLNSSSSLPGQVTRGLFGKIEVTDDESTVRFKLDPRLVNVCSGMGTGLVHGACVNANDVHTIEIADELKEAFCCTISMALLRNWAGMYLNAGMPTSVLDQLANDINSMDLRPADLDLRSGDSFLQDRATTQSLLTYDFMNAAKTVVQFINNLRHEVSLMRVPVGFNDLSYQSWDPDSQQLASESTFLTQGEQQNSQMDIQSGVTSYIGSQTRLIAMGIGEQQGQIEQLLKGGTATTAPSTPIYQVNDNEKIVAEGVVSVFMPKNASRQMTEQMIDLIAQSPIKALLIQSTAQIEPDTIRVVHKEQPNDELAQNVHPMIAMASVLDESQMEHEQSTPLPPFIFSRISDSDEPTRLEDLDPEQSGPVEHCEMQSRPSPGAYRF